MIKHRKEINILKLKGILDDSPKKKKEIQEVLSFDRQTISKILNLKRGIQAGEFLTISEICEIDPMELAK